MHYMAIHKVKRGGKTYLSEYKKVREGKKVKSIFVRYLGTEEEVKEGKKPKRKVLDRIDLSRSHKAGDTRLLWEIAKDLNLIPIIDRICCQNSSIQGPSPGKFLACWAINRIIDPESCTQLERWVKTTDLSLLSGIKPEVFSKDAFLSSLDFVCYYDNSTKSIVDNSASIDDTLFQHWRHKHPLPPGERENMAYDITSVLFFGVTCPLAQFGRRAKSVKRRQVNLALIVSKFDKYPSSHFVYQGNRNDKSTINNLLARLSEMAIDPGTLVWDRGNVSKDHVLAVEGIGWNMLCGIPKSSKEVKAIIAQTKVKPGPDTIVHKSKSNHIYAVKSKNPLFNRERSVTVYINQERRNSEINDQNLALSEIGKHLDELSEKGKDWSEGALHKEINKIVGDWKAYMNIRVKRKRNGPRITWQFKRREISKRERSYGKYVILSTDEGLSPKEVVKTYFEKDYIEKVFRILKTTERMEPVRHRLEPRVRGYMFVCVLAYRILAALYSRFEKVYGSKDNWERVHDFLKDIERVERTEVKFGNEKKILYLNMTKKIKDTLKALGMKNLFKEEILLDV